MPMFHQTTCPLARPRLHVSVVSISFGFAKINSANIGRVKKPAYTLCNSVKLVLVANICIICAVYVYPLCGSAGKELTPDPLSLLAERGFWLQSISLPVGIRND